MYKRQHFIYADQRDETTTLKELGDALGLLEYAQSLEIETWEADLQKLASSADERVWVVSRPSAAEASRQRDEEESRKQETIKREGPEGLKALQTKLDRAQEVNERDIPSEMLSCVPEPDLEEATTQLFDVQSFPGSTALTQRAEAWVSSGQQWALDHVDAVSYTHLTLPTKRIV